MIVQQNNWTFHPATKQSMNIDIENLLQEIAALPITLKDDKRSLVKKGVLLNQTVIAKQPRDKNRRIWSRILSLFRNGEAYQTMQDTFTL